MLEKNILKKKEEIKILMFIRNAERVRKRIPKDKLFEFDKNLEIVKQEYEKIKRG